MDALSKGAVVIPEGVEVKLMHSRNDNSRTYAAAVKAAALLAYDTRAVKKGALPAIPKRGTTPGGQARPAPATPKSRHPRSACSTPVGRPAKGRSQPSTPGLAETPPPASTPAASEPPAADAPVKARRVYEKESLPDGEEAPGGLLPTALTFIGNGRPSRDLIMAALQSKFEEFLRSPTEPVTNGVLGCISDLVRQDKTRTHHLELLKMMPQRFHLQNAYLLEMAIIRRLKSDDPDPAKLNSLWLNNNFGNEMLGVASEQAGDFSFPPVGSMQLMIQENTHTFRQLCEQRVESFSTKFCWLFEPQSLALVLGLAFVSRARRGPARPGQ